MNRNDFNRLRWIDPLGLTIGVPFGAVDDAPTLPAPVHPTLRAALEEVALRALQRPPCLVTFSGGRDSSTILAIAVDQARRHGLPEPIAMTHRFPEDADADEARWQESVADHLSLAHWEVREWHDELDTIGPYAQRVLALTGVGPPFNRHFVLPMIDEARGGSVLTGMGGDELFAVPLRSVAHRVRYRPKNARPRDLRGLAAGVAPRRWRARWAARGAIDCPWLRPDTEAELSRRYGAWMASMPLAWDRVLREWWWPSAMLQVACDQLTRIAQHHDVEIAHPFMAPEAISAFAGQFGAAGPGGRTRTLRGTVGDLLPGDLLARTTKASFDRAFTTARTAAFVADWDGSSVDHDLVDPHLLRAEWSRETPDARSLLLLQSAWVGQLESSQQSGHRVADHVEVSGPFEAEHRD